MGGWWGVLGGEGIGGGLGMRALSGRKPRLTDERSKILGHRPTAGPPDRLERLPDGTLDARGMSRDRRKWSWMALTQAAQEKGIQVKRSHDPRSTSGSGRWRLTHSWGSAMIEILSQKNSGRHPHGRTPKGSRPSD